MGQALYRKYRSKSLAEVVGQEHITNTLRNALKTGRISHAYLFTGPRGVGKTSVARILAHEINGIPYDDDSTHLDIIEIDAASNRRIDEIRELRDKVNIAPTSSPYKVYIIDEVHMLTKEAFNALLKTLEEPPKHVVFILATTETHKLPETIISRTQRFTFKPVPQEKVVEHLRTIATNEGVTVADDALGLIAQHGEGSFRDSISLLDQTLGHDGEVNLAYVQSLIGVPPLEVLSDLVESLTSRNATQVVQLLETLREQGFQPAQIAKQLGIAWRQKILEANAGSPQDFLLLERLLSVPGAHNPERYLEIILLDHALSTREGGSVQHVQPTPVSTPAPAPAKPQVKAAPAKPKATEKKAESEIAETPKAAAATVAPTVTAVLDETVWPQILAELKKKYNTLYGVIRMAQPNFHGDVLELGFSFAFHRKRLTEAKNQQILMDIIQNITGQAVTIKCFDSKEAPVSEPAAVEVAEASMAGDEGFEPQTETEGNDTKQDISSISNIFGGGELLES